MSAPIKGNSLTSLNSAASVEETKFSMSRAADVTVHHVLMDTVQQRVKTTYVDVNVSESVLVFLCSMNESVSVSVRVVSSLTRAEETASVPTTNYMTPSPRAASVRETRFWMCTVENVSVLIKDSSLTIQSIFVSVQGIRC